MAKTERNFVTFIDAEGNTVFINVDQIRTITVGANGIDVWFSEHHTLHIDGPGAGKFVQRITERATDLAGAPIDLPLVDEEG